MNKEAEGIMQMEENRRAGVRRIRCAECGAAFDPWDEVYSWDFGGGGAALVCEDCFDALMSELSRHERAELVGSRVMAAEELVSR